MFEVLSSNEPLSLGNLNTGINPQPLGSQDLDAVVNTKTPQALSSSDYGLNTQAVDNVVTAFQNESSLKAALGQKPSDQSNILLLPDNAGNTLATARAITVGATPTSYLDSVGYGDTNDYYRFSLSSAGNFNLSLTGLSADADVTLLNSSGGLVAYSVNGGSASESIARSLAAGTYYIRVYPYSGSTDYNLRVSAITSGGTDGAGNTLGTARNITVGSTPTSYNDWVGSTDTNDYYRFSLSNASNFNLSLTGLSSDADVALLNSSGGVIASSTAGGSTSESITRSLGTGNYYIRVYPYSGSTNYNLTVSTSAAPPPTPGYNSTTGYGLINAAAAVARGLNQSPFPDVPNFGGPNDWGANLVKAPEVWQRGYTGQGIVVAVVDTGVDRNHSDLNDNIWTNSGETANDGIDNDGNGYVDDVYGWNFVSNNNNTLDDNRHGTHVAGTIAGERNDFGVTGIAYGARIMPVKVLSGSGSGSNSGVAQGIRYAANNGADVINLSLGGGFSADIQSAVQYATSRGAIVVMAAGNNGYSSPGYPAAHATQWGLAVGAVDSNNNIAYFSNRAGGNSAMAYVTAPGVSIYSTLPNGSYGSLNGTSMATPHVAGVVALMLSANPNLTDAQVRQMVTSTAGNSTSSTRLGTTSLSSHNVASVLGIESGFWGTGGGNILEGNPSQDKDSPKPNSPQKIQSTPVDHKSVAPSYTSYYDEVTGVSPLFNLAQLELV